jgi:hypothetical protein
MLNSKGEHCLYDATQDELLLMTEEEIITYNRLCNLDKEVLINSIILHRRNCSTCEH